MLTDLRTRMPVLFGLILALLLIQQFAVVPGGGRIAGGLQNAAHGPWFALITWLLHTMLRDRFAPGRRLLVAALLAFAFALLTEGAQTLTGGDAQWLDVGLDMMGVGAAAAFIAGRGGLLRRRSSLWLSGVLLTLALSPVIATLAVTAHRNTIFPELISMSAPWYGGLLTSSSAIERVDPPAGWAVTGPVLAIQLANEHWPGVYLAEPVANWSGFTALEVELFTERDIEMHVSVRLANAPTDHVYRTFAVAPGAGRLRLPIAELFDPERARVTAVVVYSTRRYAGQVVYLNRVALTAT